MSEGGAGLTADSIRALAKKQNETFQPPGQVPHFKDFPPTKTAMILTCMDPRSNPHQFWDLGDARVAIVRNGGGRAPDFLKSVETLSAISGYAKSTVGLVAVVHHTDCGLLNFGNEDIRGIIKQRKPHLSPAELERLQKTDFGGMTDIDESVREDMKLIKADPWLADDLEVIGFVYDSFSGKTYEVSP